MNYLALLLVAFGQAADADTKTTVEGDYLRFQVDPSAGGSISVLGFVSEAHNLAGDEGLLQEGFGIGNFYVPNRRLNERVEFLDSGPDRPMFRYTYDADGPNIRGLRVTRLVEARREESSFRVIWRVENEGDEAHWVAPWVKLNAAPGGAVERHDRLDVPTLEGVVQPSATGYAPAARNWAAITDTEAKETVFAVFDADQLHSFQHIVRYDENDLGFKGHFVPKVIEPGDSWETTYRIGAVRGLDHVDFATDEVAAQLDYDGTILAALLSPTESFASTEIHSTILDSQGEASRLAPKRFDMGPDRLIRCSFEWKSPGEGAYDFLAQLRRNGESIHLGEDTASPHGGFDTQFVVGTRERPMEAWTDAPYNLDRGSRTLPRTAAMTGDTVVWYESSLHKVFPQDVPEFSGRADPVARLSLAANESESFQIVIRPPEGETLDEVRLRFSDLRNRDNGEVLSANHLAGHSVGYVPVRIPSHYENPTGDHPDPLSPLPEFTAEGGRANPIWITLHAPPGTAPGIYEGPLEIYSPGAEPIELSLNATVYDFELPDSPAIKTDFRLRIDDAWKRSQQLGYTGSRAELAEAYHRNALAHGVTLRETNALPAEAPNYAGALQDFKNVLNSNLENGTNSIAAPSSLEEFPELLATANEFVVENQLEDRVFAELAVEPSRPQWPRLLERIEAWKNAAPNIPVTVPTRGIEPFLADSCEIWTLHLPILDTAANKTVLEAIANGREVWWYVDHEPPRPYGNFFVEFAGIEHRILFWQAWALGVKGFHYWSVNALDDEQNAYNSLLDATPANGNGQLIYPGQNGPVSSIRWEIIRDGIEDYTYLTMLMDRIRRLNKLGGHDGLMEDAANVADLGQIIPNLLNFTRDVDTIEEKRKTIAQTIVRIDQVLETGN